MLHRVGRHCLLSCLWCLLGLRLTTHNYVLVGSLHV